MTRRRADLLQAALRFHEHAGDTDCPVCGHGRLDTDWAAEARDSIAGTEASLAEYRLAASEVTAARSAAVVLLEDLPSGEHISGVDLPALAGYTAAVAAAQQAPADDTALAVHLESMLTEVVASAEALRVQAADVLAQRESAWAPLAAQLGGSGSARTGGQEPRRHRQEHDRGQEVDDRPRHPLPQPAAQTHCRTSPPDLEPAAPGKQRHLGDITLEGTATRRRAILGGSVDGQPTKALPVMSQGELHALALALFLPRATAAKSPFRFVVLDDPDPGDGPRQDRRLRPGAVRDRRNPPGDCVLPR